MKLETYLRMAGINYQVDTDHELAKWKKSPTAKLPCIAYRAEIIADSSKCIDWISKQFGKSLDVELTPREVATSILLKRTIEESVYFIMGYYRWIADAGWNYIRHAYFPDMPAILNPIITPHIRRDMLRAFHGQGIARYSPEDVAKMGRENIDAVAAYCRPDAHEKFFFGHGHPTSIDAVMLGFLGNILFVEIDSPIRQHLLLKEDLVRYVKSLMLRYYPELAPLAFSLLPPDVRS